MAAPPEPNPKPEDDHGDDIGHVLRAWVPGEGALHVRMVRTPEGEAIQVRIEAGIVQYAPEGHPDGGGPLPDSGDGLDSGQLRTLGGLLLRRAQAWMLLDRLEACASDCSSVVAILLCPGSPAWWEGAGEGLQLMAGTAILLRARAEAQIGMRARDTRIALSAIDRALAELARIEAPGADGLVRHGERMLQGMRGMIVPQLPGSQRAELEDRLRAAIAAENFELAAILRDELRQLRGT